MGNRIEIKLDFEASTKTTGKYLVFDTETTGLPMNRHASPGDFKSWPYVVQIAWLLFDDEHRLIENNSFILKQSVEIPSDATNIHGITTAIMLEQGLEPSNVYANFKKTIDNTEYLVSHNIAYDIPIVHCEFLRNGIQWDFPKNRMLCTMKTGTPFCKLQQPNGKYKWPTLVELYQKCFYPGYSMRLFPDATSTSNLHSANIDAAITAQCFFKLKELGFFGELEHNAITNNLLADQTEDNCKRLHYRDERFTCSYDPYIAAIKHLGLGTFHVLKDMDQNNLNSKVAAQFKKWDEQWARKSHKTKSQADKEASLRIAEERTEDAQEKQKQIDDLLIYALDSDSAVNWDSLRDTKEFNVPHPKRNLKSWLSRITQPPQPTFRELPKSPDKRLYEPQLSLVDKLIKSRGKKKLEQAETLYQAATNAWQISVDETNLFNSHVKEQHQQSLKQYEEKQQTVNRRFDALEKDWEGQKKKYGDSQQKHNATIEKLKGNYFNKKADAVIEYCEMVLANSQYPETFPKEFNLDYNLDSKLLIVEYILPTSHDFPRLTNVKYIAARKELKESFLSETQLSKTYDAAIYKITMRILYELFQADKAEAIEGIIFNGWVNAINSATGKKVSNCIVTIQVRKEEFSEIELSNIDPKTCFKNFGGIGGAKLINITAVQPIAQINKNNKRSNAGTCDP